MYKQVEINTPRLIIKPFNQKYLNDFYKCFDDEVTKYQYPDSFKSLEAATESCSNFIKMMEQGSMLEMNILSKEEEFIGGIQVFDIDKDTPEVGLWLRKEAFGLGYGYEALKATLEFVSSQKAYKYFIYEADVRNEASLHLVKKFNYEEKGCEEFVTDSGKRLKLQTFHITMKED